MTFEDYLRALPDLHLRGSSKRLDVLATNGDYGVVLTVEGKLFFVSGDTVGEQTEDAKK